MSESQSASAQASISPRRIFEIAWGFAPPLMLEAAVKHKVFDVLDGGGKTAEQVASATNTSPRGMRALLNGLVGLEFLKKNGDQYALTPESAAFLVTTKPAFQGGLLRHFSRQLLPNWVELPEIVRTGKPRSAYNSEKDGQKFFADFVEDLFALNYAGAKALADALAKELSQSPPVKVLDLAAGAGVWGIALAEKSPNVQVTAVDWPGVTPVALKVAKRHRVADRYRTIEGDLADADFGAGYRVATLGHILHSEGAQRSQKLIKKVFAALAPGGTIAIAEFLPNNDRTGPLMPLIFAINMLVATENGDTYTVPEITGWLTAAGFTSVRTLEVPAPSPLILATKPG